MGARRRRAAASSTSTATCPGAVFVDLETELADPPSPAEGRHPLPSLQRLQAAARRWGDPRRRRRSSPTTPPAAWPRRRAWWLLRWGGLTDVRLLDGGLAAWRRAGGPLEAGDVVPEPGDVVAHRRRHAGAAIDEAAALPRVRGVLLDARAGERYRGEIEPVDPRAGHVPGAVSAPTTENLAPDGRFRPPAELRERFAALGVRPGTPVGVYCGSGVTAAHEVAALAAAGVEAALWPGSWSQWSADPAREAATGPS